MDAEFWIERWKNNEIGFHQQQFNPYLVQFWDGIVADPQAAVFVPLCGKSQDMVWLHERGHTVFGIDLSAIAVSAFFHERGIEPTLHERHGLTLYTSGRYNIYCGDFFLLQRADLPGVVAVYDRASLIALPQAARAAYVQHLVGLVDVGKLVLLIAIDYPPQQMQGPPFAVSDREVHALYDAAFEVHGLVACDILEESPRFKERGLTQLDERVYALTRKQQPAASGSKLIQTISQLDVSSLCEQARSVPRRRAHQNFHASYTEPIQRLLIAIQPESYVRPHRHVGGGRLECMLLLSGAAGILQFNEQGEVQERYELRSGGVLGVEINVDVWHAIFALVPDTVLFEFKSGPYQPLTDKDFATWAPSEGDAECERIVAWYRNAQVGSSFPNSV